MKITTQTRRVNPQHELLACFDVSKATLNLFCHYEQDTASVHLEDQLPNATRPIEETIGRLQHLAHKEGFEALRVLCESTGGYERVLLQTAHRLGCRTALVNPEHVSQLKNVESNDSGKTDHKDPRVIDLVAQLGKTQRHRQVPKIYQVLRRLTSFYDQEERGLCASPHNRHRPPSSTSKLEQGHRWHRINQRMHQHTRCQVLLTTLIHGS